MAGFPTNTSQLSQVVDPAIIKSFDQSVHQLVKEAEFRQFKFAEVDFENINEDSMSSMSGFGPGDLTIQGQQYALDTIYQGYKKTLIGRKYTKRFAYTEELQYQIERKSKAAIMTLQKFNKSVPQGLLYNVEDDFAKNFYLASGTTFQTGGDGQAIISASHPIRKPGFSAQSNIVTVGAVTNPVLAPVSLRRANYQMDRFLDDSGSLMLRGKNRTLVVPRASLETAYVIVESEYGPLTANLGYGEVSPTVRTRSGYNITVKCLNHIPDAYANYWFLVDEDRMADQLVLAKAWMPRVYERMRDIAGVDNIMASTLFGFNAVDWRWICGSTGANALS